MTYLGRGLQLSESLGAGELLHMGRDIGRKKNSRKEGGYKPWLQASGNAFCSCNIACLKIGLGEYGIANNRHLLSNMFWVSHVR